MFTVIKGEVSWKYSWCNLLGTFRERTTEDIPTVIYKQLTDICDIEDSTVEKFTHTKFLIQSLIVNTSKEIIH